MATSSPPRRTTSRRSSRPRSSATRADLPRRRYVSGAAAAEADAPPLLTATRPLAAPAPTDRGPEGALRDAEPLRAGRREPDAVQARALPRQAGRQGDHADDQAARPGAGPADGPADDLRAGPGRADRRPAGGLPARRAAERREHPRGAALPPERRAPVRAGLERHGRGQARARDERADAVHVPLELRRLPPLLPPRHVPQHL